ncbi:hypothetical protein RF11_01036 [Thelohanellus kitauei]|uniref:Uncharacterized protein n=1 Tax=Thelohanellus kitauei TaxID=669202 RepID=A0A0C2ME56_THEKT|nr:hypothetical protein RF11_01036 [Thelohanellus kitauei]
MRDSDVSIDSRERTRGIWPVVIERCSLNIARNLLALSPSPARLSCECPVSGDCIKRLSGFTSAYQRDRRGAERYPLKSLWLSKLPLDVWQIGKTSSSPDSSDVVSIMASHATRKSREPVAPIRGQSSQQKNRFLHDFSFEASLRHDVSEISRLWPYIIRFLSRMSLLSCQIYMPRVTHSRDLTLDATSFTAPSPAISAANQAHEILELVRKYDTAHSLRVRIGGVFLYVSRNVLRKHSNKIQRNGQHRQPEFALATTCGQPRGHEPIRGQQHEVLLAFKRATGRKKKEAGFLLKVMWQQEHRTWDGQKRYKVKQTVYGASVTSTTVWPGTGHPKSPI